MTGERIERRLAAILAADVVGYSRLMGADEAGTLAALKAVRRELVDPAITEHKGRIVKTTGDGLLVEFASAVDAVTCAMQVQARMIDGGGGSSQSIRLRIGINVGDIIIDGDDIFGDGVNVAARVESECEPGRVYLSDDAYRQVRGKTTFSFDDLGERALKNIDRPVRLYSVAVPGSTKAKSLPEMGKSLPLPDKPSIAVLPFQNMSGDPEQEYFADGVVEDIITALSRFKSLFVIARNSSFAYKGKSPDIRQVGRDLGVKYVLEGSVRRAGSKLRITAQLIDAQSGAHVWADRFEGTPADVFEFQDEVTEKAVIAIAPRVERAEIVRALRRSSAGSTDAYDFYLRGLALLPATSPDISDQAIDLFTKATELDPDFATAYSQAMTLHANRISYGPIADQDLTQARNEVARLWRIVLKLGSDDGRALANAAWAVAYLLRDLPSAKELVDRAIGLNPNLATAQVNGGWISLWLGHPDRAIEHLARAYRLDPASDHIPLPMAHACFFASLHEDALTQAQNFLRRLPNSHPALRIAAASAAFSGRNDVAHQWADRLLQIDPSLSISRLGEYLGPYQRPEFAEKYAEGLRRAGIPEVSSNSGRSV